MDYDLLDLTIKQSISTQRLGTISYNLTGGTFLNTNKMYFADYKHFGTNSPFLISSSDYTSFRTLNYYENSTNTSFIEGHVRLVSNRILLKRIPGLNKTLMNENIYLNYLATTGIFGFGAYILLIISFILYFCRVAVSAPWGRRNAAPTITILGYFTHTIQRRTT